MPTYIGLEEQGFWKPFEMLGTSLRAGADRRQRWRMFQQEQERLKLQDQLQRKQIKQQMKVVKFGLKQEKEAAKKTKTLAQVTPQTFAPTMAQARDVLNQMGYVDEENTINYLNSTVGMMPDVSKPLYRQPPEVQARVQEFSAQTGIPQEELAKKFAAFNAMYAPPPNITVPQLPGFRTRGVQAVDPRTGAQITMGPDLGMGGGVGVPGMAIKGATFDPNTGEVSYSMEPQSAVDERVEKERVDKVKAIYSAPAVRSYSKAAVQLRALTRLVETGRKAQAQGLSARMGPNDMALIFTFMKTIDPDSVVREGEFRAASATGAWVDWARTKWKALWNGQMLNQVEREEFLKAALPVIEGYAEEARLAAIQIDPKFDMSALTIPPEIASVKFQVNELQEAVDLARAGAIQFGDVIELRQQDGSYRRIQWQPMPQQQPGVGAANMGPTVTAPNRGKYK